MTIVNRIIEAIVTIVTAPFRALGALFGRRGAGDRGPRCPAPSVLALVA